MLIAGITGVLCLAGGWKTIARNFEWKDNLTLFLKDVHSAPNSARTNHAAGVMSLFLSQKDSIPANKEKYWQDAINYLRIALQIYPKYADANLEIGKAFMLKSMPDSTEKYWVKFRTDLMFDNSHPIVAEHNQHLSNEFHKRGRQLYAEKNIQGGIQAIEKAVYYYPQNHPAWYDLGVYYGPSQDFPKMIDAFSHAVELQPDNISYLFNLGVAYFYSGDYKNARIYFEKILTIEPNHKDAMHALSQLPR